MKQIYFHMGMHKTGTSALQLFFVDNKEALERSGVGFHYLEEDYLGMRYRNASFLLQQLRHDLQGAKNGQSRENFDRHCSSLAEYARRFEKLILTEESFWLDGCQNIAILRSAANIIQEIIGEECVIRPIIYLRRPDEWILSFWKQRMRADRIDKRTLADILAFVEESGICNYDDKLQEMESIFGKDYIIIRSYDNIYSRGKDISRDFLDSIGIPWSEEFIPTHNLVNPSISLDVAEAMNLINRRIVPYDEGREARSRLDTATLAFSLLHSKEKRQHFMDPIERRAFLDRYTDSNRAVEERYLSGERLFDDIIEPYEVWKPDMERGKRNAKALIQLSKTKTYHLIRLIELLQERA